MSINIPLQALSTPRDVTRILVMTEYRSLADAKAHLSEIVDLVEQTNEHVIVTRRGKPAAIIMSPDDYEGLLETLDILSTPGALEEIRAAHAEYLAGRYYTLEDIEEDLRKRRE